jgi:hypothetical protein
LVSCWNHQGYFVILICFHHNVSLLGWSFYFNSTTSLELMATVSRNEDQMSGSVYPTRPFVADSTARSMSLESRSLDSKDEFSSIQRDKPVIDPKKSVSSPKMISINGPQMGYRHRFPTGSRRFPSQHLRSVVTSSFSIDEERDDMMRGFVRGPPNHSFEHRTDKDERRTVNDEREEWSAASQTVYFAPATPSPKHNRLNSNQGYLHRAYSSPGYFVPSEAMKRSYYHHSLTMSPYHGQQLPPEFIPPMKRARLEPNRKEVLVSPRDNTDTVSDQPVQRTQSFPSRPLPIHGHLPYRPNGTPYTGRYHPSTPNNYAQISPASDIDESPQSWKAEMSWAPSPYSRQSGGHFWGSPRSETNQITVTTPKNNPPPNQVSNVTQKAASDCHKSLVQRSTGDEKMRMMVEAAAAANTELRESASHDTKSQYMLLAMPEDRMSLSETLCVVRENIEIFTASQVDVDAPAPGRKHAVVVGQVGLRCIHCRHTMRNSDRVKRAVCYPSSIKRIYRTVIDMKLDHFSQCKFVPVALKNRLSELKAVHTRSTGTTMLYFIKAAKSLGMEDGLSGVIFGERKETKVLPSPSLKIQEPREETQTKPHEATTDGRAVVTRCDSLSSGSWTSVDRDAVQPRIDSMSSWSFESPSGGGSGTSIHQMTSSKSSTAGLNFEGMIPLSLPEDTSALSPLRCFLREQVCAFSATEKDIAVRAPTTFSISVGQVGIGCIHCVKQSARHRSNRAVCFPFSIGRIYQSVADIQRFHFGECRMMPDDIKYKFLDLQSASSKGSKGLATRQYWMSSARKIGLVDTPTGIRFGRDPSKPESATAFSLDILAQVAFTVTTASKPLVLPEDKPCIAEFLYVVMEQLQPCRFTEADRNKRRLKDVGCIGVECKHCAGQVDSRKFFWSSVSAVESNFVSVHTHVMECKCIPASVKERLIHLKQLRKEQTAALRTGSQKSFFARVWQRLHDTDSMLDDDQTLPSTQFRELQKSASTSSSSTTSSTPINYLSPTARSASMNYLSPITANTSTHCLSPTAASTALMVPSHQHHRPEPKSNHEITQIASI